MVLIVNNSKNGCFNSITIKNKYMKQIKILFLFLVFANFANAQAPSILKVASVATAFLGDNITYTITVNLGSITNLNQLTSITDDIGSSLTCPGLVYMGNNFSTIALNGAYASTGCALPTIIAPVVGSSGAFQINFPACSISTLGGIGSFTFQIYTKVSENACGLKGHTICNTATLVTSIGTTSSISNVSISSGVPWTLLKNYFSYAAGLITYDVKLNAAYGGYSSQVLFQDGTNYEFSDTFDINSCVTVDLPNCDVLYVDPVTSVQASVSPLKIISGSYLIFKWNLPTVPSGGHTLNSYLFKVKVKIASCTCSSTTTFSLNNKAVFHALDQCGIIVDKTSSANISPVVCGIFDPVCPSPCKVSITKKWFLDGPNTIGLTMPCCKGHYEITITNCSNYLTYDIIKFKDFAPAFLTFGTATSSGTGTVTYVANTPTLKNVQITGPILPGQFVVISIPFTVKCSTPANRFIRNCTTNFNFWATNTISHLPITYTEPSVCDEGIKTIPLAVTTFLEKKVCNASSHTCAGGIGAPNTNFLPGDDVDYMLHFYNYGTLQGNNIVLKDILPNYFTIVNIATDVKIYQFASGIYINGTCDVSAMGTPLPLTPTFNTTTRELSISFGTSYPLLPFTCAGITHYFIKVKAKILATAPNNIYNNNFKIDYSTTSLPVSHTDFSNIASVTVSADNLVVFSKNTTGWHSQNCDKETDTVEYKITVANLGQLQVMFNLKDVITVPAGISLISGIFDLKTCDVLSSALPGTPIAPASPYIASHITYISPKVCTISNILLDPCHVRVITYKVIYSTAGIPLGQDGPPICNNVQIDAGFAVSNISDPSTASTTHYPSSAKLLLASNPELVNRYFETKSDFEKMRIVEEIKKDSRETSAKFGGWIDIGPYKPIKTDPTWFLTFTPISSGNTGTCYTITHCPSGIQKGCFNSGDPNSGVSFKINSVDIFGKVNTTTAIGASVTKKISKIEYVLSDVRMIHTCPSSPPIFVTICKPCTENLTSYFLPLFPLPTTGVGLLPFIGCGWPPFSVFSATYKEINRTEFASTTPLDLHSTSSLVNFQLPIADLNCGGRLEFVIAAIITYEDCTVCFVSDAYKYNASHQIIWHANNSNLYK